jgi:hypothetical protein
MPIKNNKTRILSIRNGSNITGRLYICSRTLSTGRRLATGWDRNRDIY